MNRRGKWALWLGIGLLIVLIIATFAYLALFVPKSNSQTNGQVLLNPAEGLSLEEAERTFNETFILYVMYQIKAYNLHDVPLTSNHPVIEFDIGDEIYNSVIIDGKISVQRGKSSNPDIIIFMSKMEAVKMMQDRNYVQESFGSGRSSIELVASKATLFAKGYLTLYTDLTGNSITGNVLRIYTS